MNKFLLTLYLCGIVASACAQKENNVWAFGCHAGLDFNSGAAVPVKTGIGGIWGGSSAIAAEGCASVCNKNTGQLLFYSDGGAVWNRNHVVMPNGMNLSSDPYVWSGTQSALIVPVLDNPEQYYLFCLGAGHPPTAFPFGFLAYSVVDMTLNGGLGDVVSGKKNIHLDSSLLEKMIAIPGDDCNIWVLVHDNQSNRFKAYNVTAAGVSSTPVISQTGAVFPAVTPSINPYNVNVLGAMKVSPDRRKISICHYGSYRFTAVPAAELFDFDPATGIVSNPMSLTFSFTNQNFYGTCFSPDNSKVYFQEHFTGAASGVGNSHVFQFDLSLGTPSAIQASQAVIATIPESGGGDLQVGPDGKMYIASFRFVNSFTYGGGRLRRIDNPNLAGAACQYQSAPIALLPHNDSVGAGLPNRVVFPTPVMAANTIQSCYSADSLILHASPGFFTYSWNTGGNDTALVVRGTGKFWVRMENYCTIRTDTFIVVPSPVTVDLGPDISLCSGDTAVLQTSGAYASPSYQWSTGAGTPSIKVSQSGAYTLKVTDNGCSSADTVSVTVYPALSVDLGQDTGICNRDAPLVLYSSQPPGTHYLWSNGLSDSQMSVTRSGSYWLEVRLAGCTGSDTIDVNVVQEPEVNIGADSIICEQFPLRTGEEVAGASYRWSTGETTPFIMVNSTGSYMLEVNLYGCRVYDTIQITAMPPPDIDLGGDRDICPEQTIILDGAYGTNSSYVWNTGETTSSVAVTSEGLYRVHVTTEHHCAGGDSVTLTYYPRPVVLLQRDTTVCEETPLILRPKQLNADSLRWSDGSVGDVLSVKYGGEYIVTGINKCGTGSDTVQVKQIFCDIWMPNAFTPNGDGINDVFRILGNTGRLEYFGLSIYDRWGARIFHTGDKYEGWDGNYKGNPALLGTYVYVLEYSIGDTPYVQKGNFHLIR